MSLLIQDLPWRAPEDCFAALHGAPHLAFLDSAAIGDARSDASYLCLDPIQVLKVQHGQTTINGVARSGDPLVLLANEISAHAAPPTDQPLPFSGGAVGYVSYDLGLSLQHIPSRHPHITDMPDMVIGIYDTVIGFDLHARRSWLMIRDRPNAPAHTRAEIAKTHLNRHRSHPPRPRLSWQPDFDQQTYFAGVRRLLDYIRAGDIYQANFTMRHAARRPPHLDIASLYLALRQASPAPFAACLDCGDGLSLLSASPERFLSLDADRQIEARPIKGTRPRHQDVARDQALAAELADSAKDRAENLMIVDLLRNDIGRVAEIGSIRVPELCHIESFASVHHMVSSITGKLRPEYSATDLLRAAMPGGSVTGAPKIRAMQIIDELEPCRRGPYCGTIGWIGFDGAMDSSIVIRTIIATKNHLLAQAGGGIVADSDHAAEYAEMMLKAAPMLGLGHV